MVRLDRFATLLTAVRAGKSGWRQPWNLFACGAIGADTQAARSAPSPS